MNPRERFLDNALTYAEDLDYSTLYTEEVIDTLENSDSISKLEQNTLKKLEKMEDKGLVPYNFQQEASRIYSEAWENTDISEFEETVTAIGNFDSIEEIEPNFETNGGSEISQIIMKRIQLCETPEHLELVLRDDRDQVTPRYSMESFEKTVVETFREAINHGE